VKGGARGWRARAVKLGTILRHQPYRRALRFGVAASTEHARTPLPHDYATVLDVGANRGQFALLAARRFPRARILCFEPLDGPRATIERVFTDRRRVRVVGTALAASAQASHMFVSRADDSSSLLAPTDLQLSMFPGTDVIEQVSLTTERLDVLLARDSLVRPTLLKIDVQGAELDVLIGATGCLDDIDTILVECSFVELYAGQPLADEIVRFLHHYGFRLASVMTAHVDAHGQVVQADLVFARGDCES
jgi:FkbM family methyltransferase